jgi:hypothetical protein
MSVIRSLACLFVLPAAAASARVRLFPAPDLSPSPHYRVEVQTPDGWQTSLVK